MITQAQKNLVREYAAGDPRFGLLRGNERRPIVDATIVAFERWTEKYEVQIPSGTRNQMNHHVKREVREDLKGALPMLATRPRYFKCNKCGTAPVNNIQGAPLRYAPRQSPRTKPSW
jgi:hypothetical protein